MPLESSATLVALAASLPWIIAPVVASIRMAQSTSLDDELSNPPDSPPLVSVIVPARNEAHNMEGCAHSLLASDYPNFEIIVVDDHSTDATGSLARAVAASDPRITVIDNPDLPPDWFGKQWACQTGANAASGDILIFMDADARASPQLLTRAVNGMLRTGADFYSVLGRQDMLTFWERLLQMQIFVVLMTRFGGTEIVNRARSASAKIANGQFLMVRRSIYNESGGHGLVRGYVAEDLMLAQRYFELGLKTVLVDGWDQLSTRMYTSLSQLIGGWRKNIFAGGRHSMPLGARSSVLAPLLLPLPFLMQLAPPLLLIVALPFGAHSLLIWAIVTSCATLVSWIFYYQRAGVPVCYALLFPLGAAVALYIVVTAVLRGSRVEWKGREYESLHPAAR